MNKLIFANLLHRPVRSAISVLAVAIEVIMILSIVGIFMGMLNDSKARTNGIGADLVVSPSNASFMSGMSGAPMSSRLAEVFKRMPHVSVASPVISDFSMTGSVEILYGIDYASYDALKPFVFLSGGPFSGPFDVIVDDVFARSGNGHRVGEVEAADTGPHGQTQAVLGRQAQQHLLRQTACLGPEQQGIVAPVLDVTVPPLSTG